MEWELFIGRFHPMLVHLPIGIFILGYLFEVVYQTGNRSLISSRKIIIVTYGIGFIAGIIAASTGWLLSFSDAYGMELLTDHKQLGIATLVVMLFVIIYQVKGPEVKQKLKLVSSTVAIILIAITGHLGGNLTHGSGFLVEYGPSFLKDESSSLVSTKSPDSIVIYTDIVAPLIKDKCLTCHSSINSKGNLILESYNDLFKDAAHKKPITPGNLEQSELYKRISLPYYHDKAMPPRGNGFGYTDIQVLRLWIEAGADSLARFQSDVMTKELISLMNRDYGLDYSPKPYYEKVKADSLDATVLNQLATTGFRANYLGQSNFLLDIVYQKDSITNTTIDVLNEVGNNITFLKLSNCNLSEELVKEINPIQHLTKIDLSKNKLSNEAITFLINQPNLESVNLNETDITSELLQELLTKTKIVRVYVWNTKISQEEIAKISQSFEDVKIITEFMFEEVIEAKSVFAPEESQ